MKPSKLCPLVVPDQPLTFTKPLSGNTLVLNMVPKGGLTNPAVLLSFSGIF
jgi:hypothetical protein